MNFQLIAGPIMGLIIGYITNSIAIKMLLRPYEAKYIGRFKVPFTPGLIPKEKGRIAGTIGKVISGELLSSATLRETLLSDKLIGGIKNMVGGAVDRLKNSKNTLRESLYEKTDKELVDSMAERMTADVTGLIHDRLSKFNFGAQIAKKVITSTRDKYVESGSLKAVFAKMIDDSMIESMAEPLGKTIDRLVSENSEEIVGGALGGEVDRIMDTKLSVIGERLEGEKPRLERAAVDIYKRTIENDLPKILAAVDIAKIVEDKINGYDARKLEELVFSVMKKELSAIVWLGALLGFLMGFVNVMISFL